MGNENIPEESERQNAATEELAKLQSERELRELLITEISLSLSAILLSNPNIPEDAAGALAELVTKIANWKKA